MQVPAPFEYERATSVRHAVDLLERLGSQARVIAGGHSLLPMMKLRLAQPEYLIDINDLGGELAGITIGPDEVRLTWVDNSDGADLMVETHFGDGRITQHFNTAAERTLYVPADVGPTDSVCFVVRAFLGLRPDGLAERARAGHRGARTGLQESPDSAAVGRSGLGGGRSAHPAGRGSGPS